MDCEEHEDERKEDQRNHSGGSTETTKQQPTTKKPTVNYRECQKNHAVNIGGHAVDGCCEFIPAGEGGTLEALKCAACNCHRNFHRKETDHGGDTHHHYQTPQFAPYYNYRPPPPTGYFHLTPPQQFRPLALPATASGEEDVSNNPSSNERGYGGGSGGFSISKKRVRTKFTNEQKEKMLGFAETIGWRLQGQDESEISRFCQEIGVTRHVLKVWMHNNKNTLGKKP